MLTMRRQWRWLGLRIILRNRWGSGRNRRLLYLILLFTRLLWCGLLLACTLRWLVLLEVGQSLKCWADPAFSKQRSETHLLYCTRWLYLVCDLFHLLVVWYLEAVFEITDAWNATKWWDGAHLFTAGSTIKVVAQLEAVVRCLRSRVASLWLFAIAGMATGWAGVSFVELNEYILGTVAHIRWRWVLWRWHLFLRNCLKLFVSVF